MPDDPVFVADSTAGTPVRLTTATWRKIQREHLEFTERDDYIEEIGRTIRQPDYVIPGRRGALIALRWSETAPGRPKYLAVVYRELAGDGFVITAFFLSRHERMLARGVIWQRES